MKSLLPSISHWHVICTSNRMVSSAINDKFGERYLEEREITRPNARQKGKDLETLCGEMIRNVVCLRLHIGSPKLIRISFVSSASEIIRVYWQ